MFTPDRFDTRIAPPEGESAACTCKKCGRGIYYGEVAYNMGERFFPTFFCSDCVLPYVTNTSPGDCSNCGAEIKKLEKAYMVDDNAYCQDCIDFIMEVV